MKWAILRAYYKWMLIRTHAHQNELDALYAAESARNAFALKHYNRRLETVEQDRVRSALGSLPL